MIERLSLQLLPQVISVTYYVMVLFLKILPDMLRVPALQVFSPQDKELSCFLDPKVKNHTEASLL